MVSGGDIGSMGQLTVRLIQRDFEACDVGSGARQATSGSAQQRGVAHVALIDDTGDAYVDLGG